MNEVKLPHPLNVKEHYLHAIVTRLDAVIEQNNSIIEHLGKQDGVAVEANTTTEKPARKARAKKEV